MTEKDASFNDLMHTAKGLYEGVQIMRKRIVNLEALVKSKQLRAEHWRMIAKAQAKEITRLKKGLKS